MKIFMPVCRRFSILVLLFSLVLLTGTHVNAAGGFDEITGEASVVIFENLETQTWEIRYFIIDQQSGLETQVLFNGSAPQIFPHGRAGNA